MRTVYLAVVFLWLATTVTSWAGDKPNPKPAEPLLVQEIDASAGTVGIGKSKTATTTYTLDKAFGKVVVNSKPADLTKVELGMRVLNITASGTKASRLEVETYVPKPEPKKK